MITSVGMIYNVIRGEVGHENERISTNKGDDDVMRTNESARTKGMMMS